MNQGRQSCTIPADTTGIYSTKTLADTETLVFCTGLNTGHTRAVLAILGYILDSSRLMDTGPVQNYPQNASFSPFMPVILSASLHF